MRDYFEAERRGEKELGKAWSKLIPVLVKRRVKLFVQAREFVRVFFTHKRFRDVFMRELKTHLNSAKEDLLGGFVRAFKRIVVIRRDKRFWFPALRSAYLRATYDPVGPSSYRFENGVLWKADRTFSGIYDIQVEGYEWWKEKVYTN